MFLAANPLGNSTLNAGEAALYALLGYAIVFLGLILLMVVVILIGRFFVAQTKKVKKAPAAETPVEAEPAPVLPTAPGAAGNLKLHDVEPKTAAMLMAIVADKMGKPLNELRFISIKEVK